MALSEKKMKEKLAAVVANELANAECGENDEVQANRQEALDYYHAKERGDEVSGRSKVISTDVADMINAALAMLVPMLSTDAIVEFEPIGEDDEDQASAESQVLNEIIIERNYGFMEIQEAVKDALLLKNGCMKLTIREDETVEPVELGGATAEELAFFESQLPSNTYLDRDKMQLVTIDKQFRTHAAPIENISYQSGYVGRFQAIRFFAERINYTRSDLVQMGCSRSVVDELPSNDQDQNAVALSRDQAQPEAAWSNDQDNIDCYEAYQRIDLDGDGISERYKVLLAGGSTGIVLKYELIDLIPYAIGSPFLNPHRLTGESLFDHLKATQDVKTAYRRQLIDNVSIINNGRYIYDPGQTTEADIMSPKAGGGIRARNPGGSVQVVPVPDVTSGILAAINYEDKVRSERGGASLDLMGAEPQLVGETAHGIERQYGSREAMASMMALNLSESMIRGIYQITHEYMRRYANETFTVRINGAYVETDPSTWQKRERLNIKTGMTPGERGHLQNALEKHLNYQAQAMQSGLNGILASPETLFRTSMDWLRMSGVDNPERLAIDPNSETALQMQQSQEQQQQEQQAKMEQMQAQMVQMQAQLEQAKLAEDARQHDGDLAFKYAESELNAALEEAKIAGQGTIELEKQRMVNEGKRVDTITEQRMHNNETNRPQ